MHGHFVYYRGFPFDVTLTAAHAQNMEGGCGTTGWLQTQRIVRYCSLATVATACLLMNCSKMVLPSEGRKVVSDYNQQDATFLNLFVSDGFSVYHQGLKTAHTALGICQNNTATCC